MSTLVNVTISTANVTASSTDANITVAQTNSVVTVSNVAVVSNSQIRQGFSVSNLSGFGNLAYANNVASNGVIQYTGTSQTDIRGSISNASPILYNSTTGVISANVDAIFSNTLANNWFTSQTTDQLAEGGSNLYFTQTRARQSISSADAGGDGSLSYNNSSGVITYTGPSAAETRAHLSVTDAGGDGSLAYNSSTGVFTYTGPSASEARAHISATANILYNSSTGVISEDLKTQDITEGDNLYFTPARTRSNISLTTSTPSGAGALTYNSGTGVFNFTPAVLNPLTNVQVQTFIEGDGLVMTSAITSSSNITTSANTSAAHGTFTGATSLTATGNVSVGGNLNVTGNINSETVVDLFVEDRNITLQYGSTGTPSANSQIFVDRGSSANTYILWDEGTDKFKFSNDGSTDYPIPTSTSDLAEGTNLYFTSARSRGNISVTDSGGDGSLAYNSGTGVITYTGPSAAETRAHISVTDTGGDGSLAYNSGTGVITYTGPSAAESRAHLSVTTATPSGNGSLAYDNSSGVFTFAPADVPNNTDELSEGSTNLYFTAARSRSNISVTDAGGLGSAAYNSGTGVITYTGPADSDIRGLVSVTDAGGLGSLAYNSGTGVITYTGPADLAAGKINLGSTSGTTIPVTPQNNFVTTANAFNLSNALTGIKSITSESSGDLDLIVDNSTGFVSLNREIDSVDTGGLEVDAQGFALKGLTPFNGFSASGTAPANVTGMVCTGVGPGTVTFTAGSNVVAITGIYPEAVFNGGSGTRNLSDYYGNGMVFANFGLTSSGNGNSNRPSTYPLSEKHRTISLANSTAGGTANVIVDEVSPIDFVWTGNNNWDRGLWHTIENNTSKRRLIVGGAFSASFTAVTNAIPVDRNDYYVNETGTNSTAEFDTSSVAGLDGGDVTLSGFSTAFYSGANRKYKKTSLRSTNGSTSFSNVVLIGNDAQYDDSGFGYNTWPTFGMTTLWNGTDLPGNDTGAAQTPPITPGLKFIQFTDQTIQGSSSSNAEEKSTGGPRILLNSSNGNISLNVSDYYPRQNQGLGVFGVYGSTQTNPFPRTRSQLPGGIYYVASEDWTANSGTDAYFVSTPKLTVGTDTDANAAKLFMASHNGETSLMGMNKVTFYGSGNAYSAGNIIGGYNAIKTTTEWANITATGIQTSGLVTATGNVSGANLTTAGIVSGATLTGTLSTAAQPNITSVGTLSALTVSGTIAGDNTTLKKFNETKVALGSVSGDQSSALNATNGSIYTLTATGGITINTIANAIAGTSMTIIITQGGSGSHALTSSMLFQGGDKALSTPAGSRDVITVFFDGTDYYASLNKGYA